MVAYNPWEDRRPERAHNSTVGDYPSLRGWDRRLKQRARRQLRRDYDPRHILRVLSGPPVLTYCITVSGTSYPWEQPKRRYRAAIRKLGVG